MIGMVKAKIGLLVESLLGVYLGLIAYGLFLYIDGVTWIADKLAGRD